MNRRELRELLSAKDALGSLPGSLERVTLPQHHLIPLHFTFSGSASDLTIVSSDNSLLAMRAGDLDLRLTLPELGDVLTGLGGAEPLV